MFLFAQQPNNAAYANGFMVGALMGGLLVGLLCGLIPLKMGKARGSHGLAYGGMAACAVAGLALGLLGALPTAGLFALIISLTTASPKSTSPGQGGTGMTKDNPYGAPRSPSREPYEL